MELPGITPKMSFKLPIVFASVIECSRSYSAKAASNPKKHQ